MADANDEESLARAAARGRSWPVGEVITLHGPKPRLYAEHSIEERIAHLASLSQRVWRLAGGDVPQVPRSRLPSEVFVIEHGPERTPF